MKVKVVDNGATVIVDGKRYVSEHAANLIISMWCCVAVLALLIAAVLAVYIKATGLR